LTAAIGMPSQGAPCIARVEPEVGHWRRAEVDVLAAQAAHQLRQQVQFLQRRLRRGERADRGRAVLARRATERVRDVVERRLPVDLVPLPVLLEHRARQALGASSALRTRSGPCRTASTR
jgi:hypothetical protein